VAHAEPKPEPKPEAKPEPKPEAKAEPKPEPKPEGAAAAAAGPGPARVAGAGPRKKKVRDTLASADEPKDSAKAPAETAGSDCTITIGSRPWAEVWIDGKNTNKHTPFADYKIACGKHKITFKRADLSIDKVESITVSPGEKFKQSFTLVNDDE
jgi:hypothetical protein